MENKKGTTHKEGPHVEIGSEGPPSCILQLLWIDHGGMGADGQTVSAIFYREVMRKLHERTCKKCPELWKNDFVIHHDNVPSYMVYIVLDILAKNRLTVLEHPYSPHLAPNDFFLFPKLKKIGRVTIWGQ